MKKCSGCMREFDDSFDVCPHCGKAFEASDGPETEQPTPDTELNAEENAQPQPDAPSPEAEQAQQTDSSEEECVQPADAQPALEQPEPDADKTDSPDERSKKTRILILACAIAAVMIVTVAIIIGKHMLSKPRTDTDAASGTDAATAAQTQPVETDADGIMVTDSFTAQDDPTENNNVLTDKEEILKRYNEATAKVLSGKVSFSKRRETKEGSFDADIALAALKDVIYSFMGIGTENDFSRSVAKNDVGYDHYYLQKSALTASDVSDATGRLNADGSSEFTIRIRDGGSYTAGGSDSRNEAPLDKCGISVGEGDKEYWDHKTAENIYAALSGIAEDAVIDEKYSNAVVRAAVDRYGNLTQLDVTFDIDVAFEKVYGQSGSVTGSTTVSFSDFQW